MFINEDIVAIVFRLINFICIIGLGFYFFKKHIASDIWDMITKKKAAQEALFNQQVTLEKKQCNLDMLLKEESVQCEQFRIKIDTWKNVATIESDIRKKNHTEYKAIITQKLAQRALQREDDRVQAIVLNSIVPELQKSLTHYFSNEQQTAHYLNSIVHFMDEKK